MAWKAGQSNTNAKESKQGDILHEGKHGTLVSAVLASAPFDWRAMESIKAYDKDRINHTYKESTDNFRAERSLKRNSELMCRWAPLAY